MRLDDRHMPTLSELVEDAIGGLWGSPPESSKPGEVDVLVVRGADFRAWDSRRAADAAPRRIPARALERRKLEAGDLVVEVSGGSPAQPVGRVLVIDDRAIADAPLPLICSNFCRKLRLKPGVDPYFVKRQLDWLYRSGHTGEFQTSTINIRNLQVEDFLEGTTIRLPDEDVQGALTLLLDQFDAVRDSASRHVQAARRAVERFRQVALAAACSGRLTEDWREQHREQTPVVVTSTSDSKADVKTRRAVEEFRPPDLPTLPETWAWAPVAAVASSVLGKMLDKAKNRGTLRPYLRNINVRWRSFNLDDVLEMRFEAGEEERYGLLSGDVLVCEGGEPGRAAVWREAGSDMRFQKALHRARCSDLLLPDWLVTVMQAHASSGLLANYFTGSGIAHLTGVALARVPVPLPPLAEQAAAGRRMDQLLGLAHAVEERMVVAARRIEWMSEAMLAKAFRGEFV